jgi:hypothetical protein
VTPPEEFVHLVDDAHVASLELLQHTAHQRLEPRKTIQLIMACDEDAYRILITPGQAVSGVERV